ncbi:MAG: hypothetical protein WBA57_17600 [Elainellaceae cyanobacterium]
MQLDAALSLNSLEDIIARIFLSRRITRQDQQLLMHLGAQAIQDQKALKLINSVFDALRQGLLRVVD